MNIVIKHFFGIFTLTFVLAIVNTIYGSTCGISIHTPHTWIYTLMVVGSPWCSRLGSFVVWLTHALENLWMLSCGLLMANIISYIPENSRKIFNSVPSIPVASMVNEE